MNSQINSTKSDTDVKITKIITQISEASFISDSNTPDLINIDFELDNLKRNIRVSLNIKNNRITMMYFHDEKSEIRIISTFGFINLIVDKTTNRYISGELYYKKAEKYDVKASILVFAESFLILSEKEKSMNNKKDIAAVLITLSENLPLDEESIKK